MPDNGFDLSYSTTALWLSHLPPEMVQGYGSGVGFGGVRLGVSLCTLLASKSLFHALQF